MSSIGATLLLELVGRNTAPALTLAALYASEINADQSNDPILVVAPADQAIQNADAFTNALQNCISVVAGGVSNKTIAILGSPQLRQKRAMATLSGLPVKVVLLNMPWSSLQKSLI
jgi:mannose-1-phosphate guanylyltransferase